MDTATRSRIAIRVYNLCRITAGDATGTVCTRERGHVFSTPELGFIPPDDTDHTPPVHEPPSPAATHSSRDRVCTHRRPVVSGDVGQDVYLGLERWAWSAGNSLLLEPSESTTVSHDVRTSMPSCDAWAACEPSYHNRRGLSAEVASSGFEPSIDDRERSQTANEGRRTISYRIPTWTVSEN